MVNIFKHHNVYCKDASVLNAVNVADFNGANNIDSFNFKWKKKHVKRVTMVQKMLK